MKAICLVTFQPNKIWCDFLNSFLQYKIFIVVDDNNFNLSAFRNEYININFIQVENKKCELNGYIDTSFTLGKLICGWDKALYYFGIENINYDFIWFIEDDVFFYNESAIVNIDNKYIDDDLLSNTYEENKNGNKNVWHYHRININYPPPYYHGMMCAVRFSKNMIKYINEYAIKYRTLFFLEALFPIIAIKNNLKYSTPIEFNNIHYRKENIHSFDDINNIYHPLKNLNAHFYFRKKELLPDGFNFCCYRENNDMRSWTDEDILWHWFTYGQFENRKYKD